MEEGKDSGVIADNVAAEGKSEGDSRPSTGGGAAVRFEIKKWNAVAMWSWDICADTCAICRNSLNEPSIEYQVNYYYFLILPALIFFVGQPFAQYRKWS